MADRLANLATAAAARRACHMDISPPLAANRVEALGRSKGPVRQATASTALAAESDTVTLSGLARLAVKGDPAALDRLPASMRRTLSEVAADPGVSTPATDLLFFNLVLRPSSEARQGSALTPTAASDRPEWAGYLGSLQSLNQRAMTIPGNDIATLNELQSLYARVASAP